MRTATLIWPVRSWPSISTRRPGARAAGARSAALRHLERAGYAEVTLWVLDTNIRAQRFYRAAGFSPDGAVKVDTSHSFPLRELRFRRPLP